MKLKTSVTQLLAVALILAAAGAQAANATADEATAMVNKGVARRHRKGLRRDHQQAGQVYRSRPVPRVFGQNHRTLFPLA
jgi:hypothetical protein